MTERIAADVADEIKATVDRLNTLLVEANEAPRDVTVVLTIVGGESVPENTGARWNADQKGEPLQLSAYLVIE